MPTKKFKKNFLNTSRRSPQLLKLKIYATLGLTDKTQIFDPKKFEGRIVISSTDYLQVTVESLLIKKILKEAPNVQISFRPTMRNFQKNFSRKEFTILQLQDFIAIYQRVFISKNFLLILFQLLIEKIIHFLEMV